MLKVIKLVTIAMFFLMSTTCAKGDEKAEGGGKRPNGDFGINRRVKSITNAGILGVAGELSWDLETPTTTIEDPFFNATETNPLNGNIFRATPTYYLGSFGPGEVDAGLQYYSNKVKYRSGTILQNGWGAFIRHGRTETQIVDGKEKQVFVDYFVTPKKYIITGQKEEWEGFREKSSSTSFGLNYLIKNNGHVELTVNGGVLNFTLPWTTQKLENIINPQNNEFYPTMDVSNQAYSSLNNVGVKRVIGVTQGNVATYELDGTVFTGTYSAGKVYQNGTWRDWTPNDVPNVDVPKEGTGYDVEENDKDAKWDGKKTLSSQLILTFPNIQAFTYEQGGTTYTIPADVAREKARTNEWPTKLLTENNTSRYVEETIKISLRSATKIVGKASQPIGGN